MAQKMYAQQMARTGKPTTRKKSYRSTNSHEKEHDALGQEGGTGKRDEEEEEEEEE